MLIKLGVEISRLARPMRRALKPLDEFYKGRGDEFIITSTYGGNHGANSLHYANLAIDGRRLKKATGNETAEIIKKLLGPAFDIVYHRDHIHIEYDPK